MLVNQVGALSERPPVGHGIWLTTIVGALSERPLMERHGDVLTLYVNGYVRDIDSAEDLMIEEFSRMLAKRPRRGVARGLGGCLSVAG